MSDERKMILQMLADGKINADEADTLLQAIEESERTAQDTVVATAQRTERTREGFASLGKIVDSALKEASQALDETFRSLEGRLEHDTAKQEQLKRHVEYRIRRSTEKALERVMQSEERAARAAERAAQRAQEQAERIARREEERAARDEARAAREEERAARDEERAAREEERAEREGDHRAVKRSFMKVGAHIDRVTVTRTSALRMPARAGDRFVLENRVGDVEVEFYDGDAIEVEARKTVWGSDEADAAERAAATEIKVARYGSEVKVEVDRPTLVGIGIIWVKGTRIDFTVRIPRGVHLQVTAKAGNIRVEGDGEVTTWDLATKAGDVDLTVPEEAHFNYALRSRVGRVDIDLLDHRGGMTQSETLPAKGEPVHSGSYGEGTGRIDVKVATGDIRLHH